ncbi:isochorismatase family protein [Campylobacter majalis]|uniref:isochorismatase family protein n=1 Tax=Campylobacter majalis TaxID=2790656 RepID=UPI003D68CEFC
MKIAGLMIDLQTTIINAMSHKDELLKQSEILLKGLEILGIDIITSEQYPQKLGSTHDTFLPFIQNKAYAKTAFSAPADENIKQKISSYDTFIVFGIEAHICVLQSVKDLLKLGKKVVLIEPCTSSRNPKNKDIAIATMRELGAEISSIESVLFEILGDAKHEKFKEISKLIR